LIKRCPFDPQVLLWICFLKVDQQSALRSCWVCFHCVLFSFSDFTWMTTYVHMNTHNFNNLLLSNLSLTTRERHGGIMLW
jgi:hypothetical protein